MTAELAMTVSSWSDHSQDCLSFPYPVLISTLTVGDLSAGNP